MHLPREQSLTQTPPQLQAQTGDLEAQPDLQHLKKKKGIYEQKAFPS